MLPSSTTTDYSYRQSSSSSSTSHLPQVVVHGAGTSSSSTSSVLPQSSAAAAAAAYADNNNHHSQYSALHNLHNQISRYAQEQQQPASAAQGSGPDPYWEDTAAADSRRFTERRKKTVRFDGQDSDDWTRWEAERQGSQDSATKDSGIDTSSTFTSSEDSNRGDGPKVLTESVFFVLFETANFFFLERNVLILDDFALVFYGTDFFFSKEKVKRCFKIQTERHFMRFSFSF